jgi:competence protein ComEC
MGAATVFKAVIIVKRSPLITLATLLLFLCLGILATALHISHLETGIVTRAAVNPTFITVYGVVATDPEFKNNISSFDMNVQHVTLRDAMTDEGNKVRKNEKTGLDESIATGGLNKRQADAKIDWRTNEIIRVRVQSEKPLKLISGNRLVAMGRLEQPRSIGDFDYKRYLYHRDITAILAASESDITVANYKYPVSMKAATNKANQWLEENQEGRPRQKFSLIEYSGAVRRWVKNVYAENLSRNSAALLAGIVLGDDSDISAELSDSFRITGLTHILAASGMNIALVLAALWPLLRYMRLKPFTQYLTLIMFAGFYTLVSGMQPSLTRAFLMSVIGLTAWMTGRDKNGLASISAAALILLIINPFTLFDIGFQLSFLATGSLLIFVPMMDRMMSNLPKWIRAGLSVTIAAQIGVIPILVYYFGQVSMVSALANLIIVPLAEPALVVGIALLPFQALVPIFAKPFFWFLSVEMSTVIYLNELAASLPGAALAIGEPSITSVGVMYIAIGMLGVVLYKVSINYRLQFGHIIVFLTILMCLSVSVTAYRSLAPSQLIVTFFDVGQGDSALVQSPDGVKVLIDTGPDFKILKRKLDLRGVKYLDVVIISHTHADHASGIANVFQNYAVGSFYYPRSAEGETSMQAMLIKAKKANIRCVPIDNLERTRFGNSLEMVAICKDEDSVEVDGKNINSGELSEIEYRKGSSSGGENDKCIICVMKYGEFEIMFTGDADEELEEDICDRKNNSVRSHDLNEASTANEWAKGFSDNIDVLKVGHHGSSTSSTRTFLNMIDPKVSVISVGEHNRYGHPAKSAIERIRATGAKIYRTDRNGDITIISDGSTFKVNSEF